MDYLVQRANRHDADRVIVGEVLGDEIVPMLNAMTAGKAGSMCTIHADSTEGTFGQDQDLCLPVAQAPVRQRGRPAHRPGPRPGRLRAQTA